MLKLTKFSNYLSFPFAKGMELQAHIYIYTYGLVSLLNGIATLAGYLMPKPFS